MESDRLKTGFIFLFFGQLHKKYVRVSNPFAAAMKQWEASGVNVSHVRLASAVESISTKY